MTEIRNRIIEIRVVSLSYFYASEYKIVRLEERLSMTARVQAGTQVVLSVLAAWVGWQR